MLCSRARVNSQGARRVPRRARFSRSSPRRPQAGGGQDVHRRHARALDSRIARESAPAQGAARHQADRRRLPPAAPLDSPPRAGKSAARNRGNLRRHQGAGQGTEHPDRRAGAAQPKPGEPHRRQQRPAAPERPARIGQHRAGRRRRRTARSRRNTTPTPRRKRTRPKAKPTLIIAKQRNGPIGDVPLTFLKEFTRFEDRAREEREPM